MTLAPGIAAAQTRRPAAEPANLPPEHRLILLAVHERPPDGALARLLRSAIDWDVVLALALRERAAAPLHRLVTGVPDATMPESARAALGRLAAVSDFEMLHLEQCVRETLAVLDALGAPVMLLKGAAVVHTAYGGSFVRRPMSDIDLLVDGDARARALHHALAAGPWRVAGPADDAYREHHHLRPLRDARGSGLQMEIHTALFPSGHPFGLTPDVLWAQADAVRGSRAAYVPALVHQLLHACLHFAWSHLMRFGAWRTFRDIAALTAAGGVDWDAFVAVARAARATTACYWTFRLAATAAHVRLPAEVLGALRPRRPEAYLRAVERHFLLNLVSPRSPCPSVRLDRWLWEMGILPDWSGHGEARPWDHDSAFGAGTSPSAMLGPHRAAARRLWGATRYLQVVLGLTSRGS